MEGLDAKTLMKESGLEDILVKIGQRGITTFVLLILLCVILMILSKPSSEQASENKEEIKDKKEKSKS